MTAPHIGNYGVNPNDIESNKIWVAGFVVKESTKFPSNWQSTQDLDSYLKKQKIVGIQDVNTRVIITLSGAEAAVRAMRLGGQKISVQSIQEYHR